MNPLDDLSTVRGQNHDGALMADPLDWTWISGRYKGHIDHIILDALAHTRTRVVMCQNQKCMRATRPVKKTWRRSWLRRWWTHDAWNLYATMKPVRDDWIWHEPVCPWQRVRSIHVFFSKKKKSSQCTKPVLGQVNWWEVSKQCCFLDQVFFVTTDSIRDYRRDVVVFLIHYFS